MLQHRRHDIRTPRPTYAVLQTGLQMVWLSSAVHQVSSRLLVQPLACGALLCASLACHNCRG